MEERPQLSRLPGIFRVVARYIAGKIIVPYLVVIFVLAILASYVTINLIATSLEDKFREDLAAAGRSANEAMVVLEEDQLAVLRQMVFTVGVDEAILARDSAALERLLGPIAANRNILYVDVFAAARTQMSALRSPNLGPDAAQRLDPGARDWAPVRSVFRGGDALGDKFAGFVQTPWDRLFVSCAPVKRDGRIVGAISIAVSVQDVASRLSREAGAKGITLYGKDGILASTVRTASLAEALTLPEDQIGSLLEARQIVVRRAILRLPGDGDRIDERPYVESLGVLAIRRQPAAVMGVGSLVTIIEDRGAETRNAMIALFSVVIVVVLAVGLLLARRIVRPIQALVEATRRVRRNELDFEVPVRTEDETGILTTAFNEMTGGLRERERSRVAIEKYMSPKVYRLIQAGELRMGGQNREITLFKTDIRGFTGIAETMEPEPLIEFLNRYFQRMVAPVTKYDGEVDKYMGDAILAKFGATEWYPDHARRAVLAMVEMIEACEEFSAEAEAEGKPSIRMGIGCNTGPAVVGNLGSTERMEYTIISDAVNAAERIEEVCKEVGWDLLISEQTYQQAKDVIEVGRPWTVQLRGQTHTTQVYPVLGRKGEVSPGRQEEYSAMEQRRTVRTW